MKESAWIVEIESLKKKLETIYRSPLPKKKQRTKHRGRSNKPHVYSKEEIAQYLNERRRNESKRLR